MEVEPIKIELLRQHRAVALADSTQGLPSRTYGLLSAQNVLTVSDHTTKQEAIRLGLGVGHLPKHMIEDDLVKKRLVVKQVEDDSLNKRALVFAWNTAHKGKALDWFVHRLTMLSKESNWFNPKL